MRQVAKILFGLTGQQVEIRVPHGRPTSATFQVFLDEADDSGTVEFSGTATVDAPSTTVTAASGASQTDPQRINVVTTGFAIGRKYQLAENGLVEWIEPIEIGTGYIRVRHPLRNDYSTAATFKSTTLFAAIDATFVATTGKIVELIDPNPDYRVRWTVVVSGTTYILYSFFDLVRQGWRSEVDIDDLEPFAHGIKDGLPLAFAAEDGRPLIEAGERLLRADLIAAKVNPDSLRDDDETDTLAILATLVVLAEGGWRPHPYEGDYRADRRAAYERHLEKHFLVVNVHQLDTGVGGGAIAKPQPSYFVK